MRPWQPIRLDDGTEATEAAAATRRDLINYYQYSADRGDATAKVPPVARPSLRTAAA